MKFASLIHDMQACSLCEDLPLGPRPLFKLHREARVLIAGQAPGRIAHETGTPFDDPSGDRLRAWMGIDREMFYNDPRIAILPMGLCYPGTGPGGDLPPRANCAPNWRALALSHLNLLDLTLVIGRYAMNWHLPEHRGETVTRLVQRLAASKAAHMPLPHPSPRNNRWLAKNQWFEADVVPMLQDRIRNLLR